MNNGMTPEAATDQGGTMALGYTDAGDYADYLVEIAEEGKLQNTIQNFWAKRNRKSKNCS